MKKIRDKLKEWCVKEFQEEIDKLTEKAARKIYDEIYELRRGSESEVKIKYISVDKISVKVEFTPIKDYYNPEGKRKDYNYYQMLFDML